MTEQKFAAGSGLAAGSTRRREGVRRMLMRGAAALSLFAIVACDSDPLAIFEEEPPAPETAEQAQARQRSDAAAAAAAEAPTPDLRSVPDRPEPSSTPTTREKVIEGLVADRTNARYTDEAIRLQGTGRQVSRPAGSSVATDTVASAQSNATPAPPPAAQSAAAPPPPAAQSAAVPPPPAARAAAAPPPPPPPPAPASASAPPPAEPANTAPGVAPPPRPVPQVASAPRPPSPVPPAPAAATPRNAPPAAVAPPATTAASTNSSVTVDPSALDSFAAPVGGSLLASAAGEQIATIQFAHSSSRLDDRDRAILQQVAAIQRQAGGSIVVVGHASSRTQQLDKVEHEIANLDMSMARANAVADALVASGVARERVAVEAVSDSQPMYAESMPTGEAGNRRAEVYLVQ